MPVVVPACRCSPGARQLSVVSTRLVCRQLAVRPSPPSASSASIDTYPPEVDAVLYPLHHTPATDRQARARARTGFEKERWGAHTRTRACMRVRILTCRGQADVGAESHRTDRAERTN